MAKTDGFYHFEETSSLLHLPRLGSLIQGLQGKGVTP